MILEALAVVSAIATWYGSEQAKQGARKTAKAQQDELRRQQRVNDAKAYRASRIREAQMLAQGAGSYGGSVTEGSVLGNRTALANQITLGNDITNRQIEEINIGVRNFTRNTDIKTGFQLAGIATDLVTNMPAESEWDKTVRDAIRSQGDSYGNPNIPMGY